MAFLTTGGTPKDIVAKLNAEIVRAVNLPDVKEAFISRGLVPVGNTPEQFDAFIRAEMAMVKISRRRHQGRLKLRKPGEKNEEIIWMHAVWNGAAAGLARSGADFPVEAGENRRAFSSGRFNDVLGRTLAQEFQKAWTSRWWWTPSGRQHHHRLRHRGQVRARRPYAAVVALPFFGAAQPVRRQAAVRRGEGFRARVTRGGLAQHAGGASIRAVNNVKELIALAKRSRES